MKNQTKQEIEMTERIKLAWILIDVTTMEGECDQCGKWLGIGSEAFFDEDSGLLFCCEDHIR